MKTWLALMMLSAACTGPGVGAADPDPNGSDGAGDGSGSAVQMPPPNTPFVTATHVDLSVELILPAQAELVVTTLRTFSTNPGAALLSLPGDAVPALRTLLSLVPGVLVDKLEGWINGYIDPLSIDGVRLTAAAGTIADLAQTTLTKVDLDSTLQLDGAQATQTFTQIDLRPAGIDAVIPLDLPTDLVSATTTASISGSTLTLGDQQFGIEYGEYAWLAVNQAVTQLFGADIRTTLGTAVDCPALAAKVAGECLLGVCVGHATELTNACSDGLDFLVDQVHDQFDAIDLDAVYFASGTATLVDSNGDGFADRLTGGTWDAALNVGLGLRPVTATFDAAR